MSTRGDYYLPVDGLTVPSTWSVGPVQIMPLEVALNEFPEDHPDRTLKPAEQLRNYAEQYHSTAVAAVHADSFEDAAEQAAQAVDILRLFQHARYWTTTITKFGLGGMHVSARSLPYVVVFDEGRHGIGGKSYGVHTGWTFASDDDWESAEVFHWMASAIGAEDASEGQRRALIGAESLSMALVEQRPSMAMVSLVTALEAWLLPRRAGTFTLARSCAFLICGSTENERCGRDRPTCPYVGLDPSTAGDRHELRRVRERGNTLFRWRCSEWHRVVDWYDVRSSIVHGDGPALEGKEVTSAAWWVARQLMEPILRWLADHHEDPIDALTTEMNSLPPMPDWEDILGTS